jgi:hypothetical protein
MIGHPPKSIVSTYTRISQTLSPCVLVVAQVDNKVKLFQTTTALKRVLTIVSSVILLVTLNNNGRTKESGCEII